MDDLSFNYYGKFNEIDTELEIELQKEFYYCDWKLLRRGRRPKSSHFTRNVTRGWFFVRLSKLHNKSLPASAPDAFSFRLSCKVIHKPKRCNYWHAQIEWRDSNGNVVTRKDREWRRPIQTATRTLVKNASTPSPHQPHAIPFHCYFILSPDSVQKLINRIFYS